MLYKKIATLLPLMPQGVAQPRQPLSTLAAVILNLAVNKVALFFLLIIISSFVSAQFNVTIQLSSMPDKNRIDTVYIAGSFNGWNPADEAYKISPGNTVVLKLNEGNYEFKFTRGSWDEVECGADGTDIANRTIHINSDTVLTFSVIRWKEGRKHTASGNVHLVSGNFEMPLLHKQRKIWVYLPAGYEKNKTRYPVLYMQDGQNVFDEYTAPFGEWGVDECLDSLIAMGKPGCIVVAIETGGMDRMSEYNPYEFTFKGEKDSITFSPKADDYLTDIIKTLKPYIDKKFRTLSSKENTIIAGSSMGGLISYYASLKYPAVFGKAGIFSPAFWTASGIDSLTDAGQANMKGKYFFFMGGKEGDIHIENMKRISGKLGKNSSALIYSVIDPEAEHKEKYWRKWFAEFYNWIMAEGYNINTSPGN